MKKIKTHLLFVAITISVMSSNAQTITSSVAGKSQAFKETKNSEVISFSAGGNNYFFTTWFEQAMTNYYLECFNSKGEATSQSKLEINHGVFNNSFRIDQVIGFGDKVYAMVEHLDKPSGKNSLAARVIDHKGKVSTEEFEIMNFPFEKTMNSGFNQVTISPDQELLLAIGELPYVKDESAKVKIAIFNKQFQQTGETTITIPGEDTKNKTLTAHIANDGTVYIIKRTTTKIGEIALQVFQIETSNSAAVIEYNLEMVTPQQFYNYTSVVNNENELIISGTYYERKSVQVGEKTATGIFYFTNKNKSEKIFSSFTLNTPVENLVARKLFVNGQTLFLTAEQFKEEKITPPATTTATSFDYDYKYHHKNEFIIGLNMDGSKKFELNTAKDFMAINFDKQYSTAYYLCNGKLTIIYNDLFKKYSDNYDNNLVPILVQITNDGLMFPPVIFDDKLKLPYNSVLYPIYSVQNGTNELSLLLKNAELSQFMRLIIN